MGASLTSDISFGCPSSYINFSPPANSTNVPAYSQSFSQDGYSFTIIYFYSKRTTLIYLIKMHGLSIESFKKNENIQFRFIFHFFTDQLNNSGKNNQLNFKTSAVFSYNNQFISIPNLTIPFNISVKYIDDDSDFSIFSTFKNTVETYFHVIPKLYDEISSYVSNSSTKLLKFLLNENKNENYKITQNDKLNIKVDEQQIQQIEHKKIITQEELRILQENFYLNDTDQIPYVGIDNLGLTCYISAALHFLSSVTPFVELLLNTKAKKNSTSYELQQIFVKLKIASIVAVKEKKRKNPENIEKKKSKNKQNRNKVIKNKTNLNEKDKYNDSNNDDNTNDKKQIDLNDNKIEKSEKENENKENEIKKKEEEVKSKDNANNDDTKNSNKDNDDIENDKKQIDLNDDKNENKENETKKKEDKKEEEEEEEDLYDEFIVPINSSGEYYSSISILKFVSSFGKKLNELVFNEQDTHEFITILFDKIDSELGKEFAEKRKNIFGVTLINFIQCKKANYGSQNEEELNDISLPVVGNCSSISKSLDKITAKEQMKGDNMYDTGDSKLGKQEAIRFMKFKKLPPFLTFHLMRYAQNEYTMSCEEVNSYFECPDIIDMKKYICYQNEEEEDLNETKYKLMAIIAHRGSLHSGHYVSYLSPNVNDNWFFFNDSFVSESSIKDVQKTYGKSATSTLFGVSSIFHQSNNFYSYLVGYVRLDYIKKIKYGLTAPIELVPNALIKKYSVLVLDLSDVSNKSNDETLSDSNEKINKQIYGEGEIVEWSDANETIENVIITSEKISDKFNSADMNKFKHQFFNKNQVFVIYPEMKQLFGPIQTNLKASSFIISGHPSQFLIINKIEDPVFICKKKEIISVENRRNVFKKYDHQYLIKYEKKIITDKAYEFPVGSIITLLSREPFLLQIRNYEFKVTHFTTYQEIQQMIAKAIIESIHNKINNNKNEEEEEENESSINYFNKKNLLNSVDEKTKLEEYDNFDFEFITSDDLDIESLSSRIILYQGVSPLKPRAFLNAHNLYECGKLNFRILIKPATANSLDMYTPISINYFDLDYKKHQISGLWFSKEDTMNQLFDWSNQFLKKDDKSYGFVLSSTYRNKIQSIIDRNDDFETLNEIRLDLLKTDFPDKIDDYESIMKKFEVAPIEVRTVLYEPLFKQLNSIGFFYFNKKDTYNVLLKKITKSQKYLSNALTHNITIETQNSFFKGYKPKGETVIFDSIQKIKNNPNFQNQRPILTIQIHKKF